MGLVIWIILGVVGGIIASRLTNRRRGLDYGLNIVVGIVGAVLGGFITNLVILVPVFDFNIVSFFVAALGTLLFLALFSTMRS